MTSRHDCLLFIAALACVPGAAGAQGSPSQTTQGEARSRFDRGLALFEDGDNAGALAEFKRAYELIPNPVVLFNVGLVYAAMNRPAEATDALQKLLKQPGALSADHLARAKQTLAEQAVRVAEIAVTSNVPAMIEVDNVEAAKAPLAAPLRVAGGSHIVGAIAPGFAPQRKEVTVAGSAKTSLAFELVAMEGTLAHLTLKSPLPAADVMIDGELAGRTPLASSLTLAPGTHRIELRRRGYQTARQDLTLGDGASGELSLDAEEDKLVMAEVGGDLKLNVSEPEALVTIDGKSRGLVGSQIRLASGPHRLLVERGGFRALERDVTIDTGKTVTVPVVLEPTPETRQIYVSHAAAQRSWAWIGIGGGLALAAGGVGYLVYNAKPKSVAQAERDAKVFKREQMLGNCATKTAMGNAEACNAEVNDAQDRLNSASARDAIGYIGIGVGGAALGLGLYWLLTGDDPHRYDRKPVANEVARSLVPVLSVAARGATLLVEGRF